MKYLISIILATLIVLAPSRLLAQQLEKPKPLITNVKKGERTPFDGVLLDPWAMSEIMADIEYDQKRFELELEFAKKQKDAEWSLRYDTLNSSYTSLQFKYGEISEIKDREIKTLREIAVKKKDYSILWYAGGFLSGVALSLGVLYIASDAIGR